MRVHVMLFLVSFIYKHLPVQHSHHASGQEGTLETSGPGGRTARTLRQELRSPSLIMLKIRKVPTLAKGTQKGKGR